MTTIKDGVTDTAADIETRMIALYREMPAWRKLQLVDDANRAARMLSFAGNRARHPEESVAQHRRRLLVLVPGEEMVSRAYGAAD